jgi:hypothetical protein
VSAGRSRRKRSARAGRARHRPQRGVRPPLPRKTASRLCHKTLGVQPFRYQLEGRGHPIIGARPRTRATWVQGAAVRITGGETEHHWYRPVGTCGPFGSHDVSRDGSGWFAAADLLCISFIDHRSSTNLLRVIVDQSMEAPICVGQIGQCSPSQNAMNVKRSGFSVEISNRRLARNVI